MTSTKMYNIHGEQFPYEEPQYYDVDRRITGKHLYHSYVIDLPESKKQLMQSQGVLSIEDLAKDKLLEQDPDILNLNYYGTYRKGVWATIRKQVQSTMYWAMNKQPASFTMYTDKIDEVILNQIKMLIQNGVMANICIPATGYTCSIPAVYNKKQQIIFTKQFICEKYKKQYEEGTLTDTEILANIGKVYEKCKTLADYRATLQEEIWNLVNYVINPLQEEWKCQNIYTVESRIAYAIQTQTQEILAKYARDMHITAEHAITLEDILIPTNYNQMIQMINNYAPAFGINIKTEDTPIEVTTFMPVEWLRNKNSESSQLKQALRIKQGLAKSPLNELVSAYLQIDWYLSQPDPTAYYLDGFFNCTVCNMPVREYTTHYALVDAETEDKVDAIFDLDTFCSCDKDHYLLPAAVCYHCGQPHVMFDAIYEGTSYDLLQYKINKDVE